MNYRYVYVFILSLWDLISPVVSMLRQTGDGTDIFNSLFYLYIFIVMLSAVYVLMRKKTIRLMQLKYLFLIVLVLFLGTLVNIYTSEFNLNYFSRQAASWLLFLIIFMSYDEKIDAEFEFLMSNILWYNILFNIISAILFRSELLGPNSYFTFDISGIILSAAYLAKYPKRIPLFLVVASSLIAMKRAIVMVIITLWISTSRLLVYFNLDILFKIMRYSFTLILIYILYIVANIDMNLVPDLSLAERFMEVRNSLFLFDSFSKFIFGNGLGWSYPIFLDDPSDFDLRGFTHITPVFLIISLGLFGIISIQLLYSNFFVSKVMYKKYSALMIFGLLSLIMSFSRLNIFTDPIVALSVSSLLLNRQYSK